MPEVSVVIPVHNRESSIEASIMSVLRQTFSDFELLVVDDASEDGTLDVLSRIRDERIRIVRRDHNGGASAARNSGIREATGHYVAFQDSDDEWLPRKLEMQLEGIESTDDQAVGVYCGMIVVGGFPDTCMSRREIRYIPSIRNGMAVSGRIKESLLRYPSFISTQTLMVRRDALMECGGFDESLPVLEDWDLAIRVAGLGPIVFIDEPLVIQKFSNNSLTRSVCKRVESMRKLLDKHSNEFKGMPDSLVDHYLILAGGYRAVGDLVNAQNFYLRALSLRRLRIQAWLGLGISVVQRLTRQIGPIDG